ncbi:hypothetical protein ALC53_13239 [Atta colombica]|uniref:Uncharacterized protein n=1 Tax=Atta colombica TaxID=520822 RepID=A0A195AVX7_9HYME|nr:hypothetical protein ALC53_13239 [Atta colombica]
MFTVSWSLLMTVVTIVSKRPQNNIRNDAIVASCIINKSELYILEIFESLKLSILKIDLGVRLTVTEGSTLKSVICKKRSKLESEGLDLEGENLSIQRTFLYVALNLYEEAIVIVFFR